MFQAAYRHPRRLILLLVLAFLAVTVLACEPTGDGKSPTHASNHQYQLTWTPALSGFSKVKLTLQPIIPPKWVEGVAGAVLPLLFAPEEEVITGYRAIHTFLVAYQSCGSLIAERQVSASMFTSLHTLRGSSNTMLMFKITGQRLVSTKSGGQTYTPIINSAPPKSTVSPTPVPFSVIGVNVSVGPSNFHGVCTDPMTFTFKATINAPAGTSGGTVTYTWLRSDESSGPTETISFPPGTTTQTVTTTWKLGSRWGNGMTFWEALQVSAPNSLTSAHANFSFVCQSPAPTVTSISASVSPQSYDCNQSQVTFNFNSTIYLSANPTGVNITYVWRRSDGASMSPITNFVPAGPTTVKVTNTWTLSIGVHNGSYWERVDVSAPNSVSSNQAAFTVSCQIPG